MSQDYLLTNQQHQIHCEATGPADAKLSLLLIHGLASNATRWCEFMNATRLKDYAYLLAINLRGHGKSLCFDRYTRQDWCEDVQCVMQQTGKPTILIGHSLGAQVALELAAAAECETLKGLVLIDPVFPQALTGMLQKAARHRRLIWLAGWLLRGFYRLGLHKRNYPYRDLQKLDEETRDFLAKNPDKGIADLYMNPFADLKYIPLGNYLQDLYEVTRPMSALSKVHVPVLVLLSTGASTSHVDTNRNILAKIPRLDIEHIDADHWLLTERPVEAREVIEDWCEKLFSELNLL